MSDRPAYFEPIRERAANRWAQLEGDPELAAPWHQLFMQVQSPRHVLSELLQNADDAGATEASATIEGDAFVFRHNGEDFEEEHFASLCRFGYSNKRALHTIGFRGIGFKSTFSLGEKVELLTPTLAVQFDKRRFTEPLWIETSSESDGRTIIRVRFSDDHLRKAVKDSFTEWLKSPISLLFFRSIRRATIGDSTVHWHSEGPGPVAGSEWFCLDDEPARKHLFIRSKSEPLPHEALEEIRKERMVAEGQELDLPPCHVEIILGTGGRLFVVLPTGVKTDLPFSCNAPFLQDTARYKIKDPAQSPTNRWLLERIGRLAGEVMLEWLNRSDLPSEERAAAYDVMPDLDREASSLEGVCGATVERAFEQVIQESPIVLTDAGPLAGSGEAVLLPRELFEVWPADQVIAFFDENKREPLSAYISDPNLEKLKNWNAIDEIDHQDVLNVLQERHFPRPPSWRQLLALWAYVDKQLRSYEYYCENDALNIVPVQGKDILCAASEVIRLGEKRIVPSEDDWQFLGDGLSVLNQNWMRFLTEQRRLAENDKNKALGKLIEAADHVLEEIGLDEPSDTSKVVDTFAASFFAEKVKLSDAVRLAQIAARLGAQIGESFKYVCQDRKLRSIDKTVLYDDDGSLGILLPDHWAETHLLHPHYVKEFISCTREEWDSWVRSGRAGLGNFVALEQSYEHFWGRRGIDHELARRGYTGRFQPRYSNPSFRITDWNFDEETWEHWEALSADIPAVWGRIVERVLSNASQWSSYLSATVTEQASNGHTSRCVRDGLAPAWVLKLRQKPCLQDTHGVYRKPDELLMRSPDTEALMDIEPFVHGLLDSEATKSILRLLGVSDKPTGPEKLLIRLQALSKSEAPPAHEVDKWYRRLDQLVDGCSTEMFQTIRHAFEKGRLILSEGGTWENTHGVFLAGGDEDVPDAPLVRSAVRELTLWRKIGVGERPTAALAVDWLKSLESGKALSPDDLRRAKALIVRYPARIWNECGHWLNLAGEWAPASSFAYSLSMQTLTPYAHLHQWVKQATADLRGLSAEAVESPPFDALPPLASHIEERFSQQGEPRGEHKERAWLAELGSQLRRIRLGDQEETERVRKLGAQLARTNWISSAAIEIVPYIVGKPAGTARHADVLWLGEALYAQEKPLAKLARAVAQEIGKAFRRPEIIDAIKMCFDRPASFVAGYMEENFELIPESELAPDEPEPDAESDDREALPDETCNAATETNPEHEQETLAPPDDDVTDETEADETGATEPNAAAEDQEQDDDEADVDVIPASPPRKPRESKPHIMERFALAKGFKKDGDSHFYDAHGCIISKADGSLFPWEHRSASGDVTRRYWPKDHCLEREPLQLGAEVWGVLEQSPESYVLVLSDADGEPVEVTGKLLTELRDRGVLALHPSTYRLVIEHEKQL